MPVVSRKSHPVALRTQADAAYKARLRARLQEPGLSVEQAQQIREALRILTAPPE